jgi:filamentous hemagglutinin family protein
VWLQSRIRWKLVAAGTLVVRTRLFFVLLAAALASGAAGSAFAGPNGGTVIGGSATIQGAGTGSVIVNQSSQRAIINWNTFNIGNSETTQFVQPNSSSIALNRVVGGLGPTQILGTLMANGQVFVINGDGVLIGPKAVINTAGFLATTNDIRNQDFMAGKYNFGISGLSGASVVNLGNITATSGGFAALVAPGVRNSGTITATLGTVSLAAGNAFTVDFYGDKLITLAVNDQIASKVMDVATGKTLTALVSNQGKLSANGGRVELTAAAARAVVDSVINNTGVIEANSIGTRKGMIVLGAATAASKPAGAPTQTVKLSGKISAAGKDKGTTGGTVVVTGENIAVAGAQIDASGQAGGGKVLIGGDTGGGNPSPAAAAIELAKLESFAVPTATSVSVDAASTINASATGQGNGGKVILWSEQQTTFAGTVFALGGSSGGNGGFVETSGHQTLAYTGVVDLRAPMGTAGTVLLDPADFYISNTGAPAGASAMTEAQVEGQLALGNLTITTNNAVSPAGQNGDIFVNTNLIWSSNSTLTLSAANTINLSGTITATNGGLTLNAGNAINPIAAVDVTTFTLQHGSWSQVAPSLPVFAASDFRIADGSFLRATGGDGSNGTPYRIADIYGLQGIGSTTTLLGKDYVLANNIDASGTAKWNAGAGFAPIGRSSAPFIGSINGQGNTVSNLTINRSTTMVAGDDTGLFGFVGSVGVIQNIGLLAGSVTGENNVGALVGTNDGEIANSYASGPVNGSSQVGALVGHNTGSVTQSHASGAVTGSFNVGGLVGLNAGSITLSYWNTTSAGPANTSGLIVRADECDCLTITADNQSKVYGTALNLGTTAFTTTGTLFEGDSVTAVTLTSAGAAATANVAGSPYAIVASNAQGTGGLSRYTISYVNGALTVTPAPLTITANDASKSYDGQPFSGGNGVAYSGFVNGETASVLSGTIVYGGSAQGAVNVSSYQITASGQSAQNYAISYQPGTLTVNQAPLTIAADNQSKTYGTVLNLGTSAFTTTGTLFNGDSVSSVTLASAGTAATANVAGSPYAIVPSNAQGTGLGNYAITYVNGALAVGNATLTVTANTQSSIYGNAIPPLTFVVGTGLLSGDTISGSLATSATPTSPVGQYAITQGTLAAPSNYILDFVGANLTINPRPLTVVANPQTRVYGDPNPPLGFVIGGAGLVNGDTLTGNLATTAATTSNVGSYPISQGTLSNPNYAISYSAANLSINPRPLTVLANPEIVILGTLTPQLTFGVGGAGLVNGDAMNGSLTTTLPLGAVGQFPITEGTLGNPNYAISFVPATLTVVPPPTGSLQQTVQNLVGNGVVNLVSLTPGEVVNIQGLDQILPPTTGPTPGPGGLPARFGNRFFVVPPPGETRFVKDEVVLYSSVALAQLDAVLGRLNLTILGSYSPGLLGVPAYRVHIGNGRSVGSVIQALAAFRIFAGAQANYIYVVAQDLAQDPDLAGRTQEGDAAQYALGKLGLIDIHRQLKGANVTIAVIDSQIDVQHPDLDGVIVEQFDAVGVADKPHPHGTGMAGAIAAHRRLMGIAPSARLYAVHAFSSGAASAESTTFNILKGLDWAASKGVRVINMSFAGPRDPTMERALKNAHDKGIVLIAAAGNAGPKSPPLYPGADPNVIAVTATDVDDKLFTGANRGRYIAVAAPGVDILVPAPDAAYQLTTGTSVASAEVSGIVALMLERNPNLTPDDIRKILTSSAKHPGAKERDDDFGSGLVDPSRAVQTAGDLTQPVISGAAPRPGVDPKRGR